MLEILTSSALKARHGFFTRRGGASSGVFAGLNCGSGPSDLPEIVEINRARGAAAMEVPIENLVTVHQVHSADVVRVGQPMSARPKADAMVTAVPGIGLGILTADCAPILFHDAEAGVIGAAHAGWKGALGGVAEATVAAMEAIGARRDRIAAAVGPGIAQPSYEVGPDFPAPFLDQSPDNARFFPPARDGARPRVDLAGYVLSRLTAAGIGRVEALPIDTYAAEDRFYSFRRATHRGEPVYGRKLSAIALEK